MPPTPYPPCSATIGYFDGVHRGHLHIINHLIDDAKAHGLASTIITFRQHPRQVLQKDYIPKLLLTEEKKGQALRSTKVDNVISMDFTLTLSLLSARDFMALLYNEYAVQRLLIGYDHRFGHNRSEGFDDYVRYGKELGITVVASDALAGNETNISSSAIRRFLLDGNIGSANEYLGYSYGFEGIVVRGRGEGKRIGFPTANLLIDHQQLIPKRGVYSVGVAIEGYDEHFLGMMNIGCRPTFGCVEETVEVNILNFDEDIYDRKLSVAISRRLRDERKFHSVSDLVSQLNKDKADILTIH